MPRGTGIRNCCQKSFPKVDAESRKEAPVVKTENDPQVLGYTGDITPQEAWDVLQGEAELVDVRTNVEWAFVGITDLTEVSKQPIFSSWQVLPAMQVNERFIDTLKDGLAEQDLGQDVPLLFLCRSGQRSIAAARAAVESGFSKCFNILGGFEGDLDDKAHRGTRASWKAQNLPWVQK